MRIYEATVSRIEQLLRERRMTVYALSYGSGVPESTIKGILNGKSKNPGIVNIKKIAEGFDLTIQDFFINEIFENLDQED